MKNRVAEYVPTLLQSFRRGGNGSSAGPAVKEWLEPVEKLVRDYPAASLGVAFAIGVTIAWFVKRK
jgi:hypothetical protein